MDKGIRNWRRLVGTAGAVLALSMVVPAATSAASTSSTSDAGGCRQAFDDAQRIDMESFASYDAETFRAGHHEDAVTIFASGFVAYGVDAIMEALAGHFEDQVAIWTWTELHRFIDRNCQTGYILYDTVYEIPDVFLQHALVGVTYAREQGRWLAVADQGTLLPAG